MGMFRAKLSRSGHFGLGADMLAREPVGIGTHKPLLARRSTGAGRETNYRGAARLPQLRSSAAALWR